MSRNIGLLASFEYVDSAVNAIHGLKAAGHKKITAYMPYPDHHIEEALGYDQSPVRVWALAGGLLGAAGGFAFTVFTSLDWPLVTGGKPILSMPAYVIISFEMMVLFGVLSTVIGLFVNSRLPYMKPMVVYDPEFSAGKFGIYVTASADQLDQARGILQGQDPSEIREDPVGVAHAPEVSDPKPGVGPGSRVQEDLVGAAHATAGVASGEESRSMLGENLKIFAVVLGTIGLFTLVANSIPQVQSEVPVEIVLGAVVNPEEMRASGEILFNGAGTCTACHGTGTRAPNLLTDHAGTGLVGVRCANRVPGEDCKTYLYASMTDPNAFIVEGFDPIMTDMRVQLSNAQIWALVAYLESLGGEASVTRDDIDATGGGPLAAAGAPAGGAAAAGPATASTDPLEIMRANTCFVCHVLNGEGVPMGPEFDGIGARVAADYIRESILDPAAGASEGFENLTALMPPIFGNQLSAGQLEAVVQFLASQR